MEIEFRLSRADFAQFLKLVQGRVYAIGKGGVKFPAINFLVWLFIGLGFAGIYHFYQAYEEIHFWHLNLGLGSWAFGVTGLVLSAAFQRKFFVRYALDENGHTLKRQRVTFSDDGIRMRTQETDQVFRWSAIQGEQRSKDLICLWVDNCQALLIPTRAFADEAQLQAVSALIAKYVVAGDRGNGSSGI